MAVTPAPTTVRRPRFALGRTLATTAALEALAANDLAPDQLLWRHEHGDWGDLDAEDIEANERDLRDGARLLSRYDLPDGEAVYVITEWDRSATTILLVNEY